MMRESGRKFHDFVPGSGVETTVTIKPGDSLTVGGMGAVETDLLQGSRKFSSQQIVVTLIDMDSDEKELTPREPAVPE